MAQHARYWSCSKFADWLRGTTKGGAKTSDDWHEWKIKAQEKYPIRYWIAEELLDKIQDLVTLPERKVYDMKYYINNRWVTCTHQLTAHPNDIKPGDWCDVGNRFLPCLFNELVDFVEIELAWSNIAWSKEARVKYNAPFYAWGWFRWRTWRCPQAGIDHLEWERTLVWTKEELGDNPLVGQRTGQAKNADEILALYKWWKEIYPNRPDPHDASGWSAYCDMLRAENGDDMGIFRSTKNLKTMELGDIALKKCNEIEEAYKAEDEEMMIRLIKIRHALWT